MSIEDTPKHLGNLVAATAPVVSYWTGISEAITILAGLASLLWLGASLWKLFFPERFDEFVRSINRRK